MYVRCRRRRFGLASYSYLLRNLLRLGCRRVGRHLINACLWLWLRGRDCRISHTSVSGFEVTGQTLLKTRVRVASQLQIPHKPKNGEARKGTAVRFDLSKGAGTIPLP
jgi:hypothetical protein